MGARLQGLSVSDLRALAEGLRTGRLYAPFTSAAVLRYCPAAVAGTAAGELQGLADAGFGATQIAVLVAAIADERDGRRAAEDIIELVTTGPEAADATFRDTAVVVRELFAGAKRSVTVVGYAVHGGREVFAALAERMDADPALRVRMYLDVQRPYGSTVLDEELLAAFAHRFRTEEWPGKRLPEVFYDPRSLATDAGARACLHAKCIVVDGEKALVTSANFTEAAQNRNIEVGLLVESPVIAANLEGHFEELAVSGTLALLALRPVFGLQPPIG